jgi:hypothetical protein
MCTVSMIGDHFNDKWRQPEYQRIYTNIPDVSRSEFESLKKEVEEMKALLKRAKEYDERNNEPDCELEEKMAMLRKFADAVGLDLDDIIKKKAS